jgi:hypothetical protein
MFHLKSGTRSTAAASHHASVGQVFFPIALISPYCLEFFGIDQVKSELDAFV